MASGSSGRGNSGSKGFDFGSDDILCSYEDYSNRDSNSNGNHTDPVIAPNSTKDYHKSRVARTSMFPTTAYNPPEDSFSQDVIATVEKSMKKYADNLMRFLEGISSRLSQLELYCYNLDKSIGEMRSDLNRDHGEQDSKLKSLEKHLQEKRHTRMKYPKEVQPPQPPSLQGQIRPPSSTVYPPYQPNQATNSSPTETLPNSMPMQMPYSGVPVPPPGSSRADTIPYGYGGSGGRPVPQQPPPQQIKSSFPAQPGDVYGTSGTHPALPPPGNAYMMYDSEGGRTHHTPQQPPHFAQAGYPPTSASLQNPTGHNLMVRNPSQSQFVRNHPYSELIEKLVSMGFRGDHVASVIQRMEDSGQPIDFNSVLDRLNVHSSVGPQRGWSG
ncbi:UBA-like domain DUF1421 [Sesbania bispinosa]|nr:UBA-like domain DUF1421 [Sesbania bispinosa]